jgi:hypothetical protein
VCRLARFHGCPSENFVRVLKDAFKLETSPLWFTDGIGLTGVIFHC